MANEKRKQRRKKIDIDDFEYGVERINKKVEQKQEIKPLNSKQEEYIKAIKSNQLVFVNGPAGTGKSYIAAAMAAQALEKKQTNKIILTRPAVEAGESLGHLPGDMEEKYMPYIEPFIQVLYETLGRSQTDYYIKKKIIEPLPIGFMRGRTFKDCWVVLDEAQNTTANQMQLFLTRIGENSTIIVDGDTSQRDIRQNSGLADGINITAGLPNVKLINFTRDDVVRSDMVGQIIKRYDLAAMGAI